MCEIAAEDIYNFCNGLVDKHCLVNPKYLQKDKMIFDLISAIDKVIEAHNSGKFSDFENMPKSYSREEYHSAGISDMICDLKIYGSILMGVKEGVEYDSDHCSSIQTFLEVHGMNVE